MKRTALRLNVPCPRAEPPARARARVGTLLVLVSLLVGASCSRPPAAPDGAIVLHGNIEVVDAQLSFKIPGRLIERAVDEGDSVTTGQLVARLDEVELGQQLDLRRAELTVAAAALAELEAGSRPQELEAAEAALRGATAELDRARIESKRQEELRTNNVSTERDVENTRAQLAAADARVVEATAKLALLREGPRRETIAQARARVAQAQATAALAESQVANARLTAPLPGVVLERHAEPGEFVAAGAPILTVANTARVWVRAYVNATDLGHIRLGQAVEVRTDSYPEKTYIGKLTFISSEAEFTPKTVQTARERVSLVFRVKVDLDNASGELKPGMPADATLAPADAR